MRARPWRLIRAATLAATVLPGSVRADVDCGPIEHGASAVPFVAEVAVVLIGDPYLYVGGAALIAIIVIIILALHRPRQAVVRTVKSYVSRWLRRGGEPRAEAEVRPGDWLLTGTDRLGGPIRLVVAQSALAREDQGVVVGRSRQIADVVLVDATVSRRHARLVRQDGGLAVIDLKSKRGTWVGSRRLEPYDKPTPLEVGDLLRLGTVTLRVERA
ncbi:MAG TPA: FHA domain-containing protein [Alphaproteobacteria bacterium]|jgi:hypothetical protein